MSRTKDKSLDAVFLEADKALKTINNSRLVLKLLAIRGYRNLMAKEVSVIFNTQPRTVLKWVEQFKENGVAGLLDHEKGHRTALINQEQRDIISEWIESSKTPQGDQIHWTLGKLCNFVQQEFGIVIRKSAMENTLIKMGLVLRRPRPSHINADPEKQAEYKKNSGTLE